MAARPLGWIVIVVSLLIAGCPSSPPLTKDEVPGDFHFSYEMKVTDEEAFLEALEAEEPEAEPEEGEEPPAEGEEASTVEAEDTKGMPRTFIYVEITDPGYVKYEVHFGFGNPVKRTGSVELTESAFQKIYQLVRQADVFSLNKRYIGDLPTGKEETFVIKGNLHRQVIDVKGAKEPRLDNLWVSVKGILLDRHSRIFDNPEERPDIFIIDKRNREFHRGDCPRLNEVSSEFRIRKQSTVECLNAEAWPCETCRPLEVR